MKTDTWRRTLSLACLLLLVCGAAAAAVFQVTSTTDLGDVVPGDGECAFLSGFPTTCTLRAAIQESNALAGKDTILLPAGTFTLTLDGDDEEAALFGDLDILEAVQIVGAGPHRTVIDAGFLDRVFDVYTAQGNHTVGTVDISGLKISGGSVAGRGAGIYVRPAAVLNLSDCVVAGNLANAGAGLAVDVSTATVTRCEFFGNLAVAAGAGAVEGGGVFAYGGSLDLVQSSLHNNQAIGGAGGAIFGRQSDVLVDRSTISSNNPDGIEIESTIVDIRSSTVAESSGSALVVTSAGTENTRVRCSILSSESDVACQVIAFLFEDFGYNLFSDTSCPSVSSDKTGNPGLGPLAGPPGSPPGRTPLASSLAADGGSVGVCSPTDQFGQPRTHDNDGDGTAEPDIGALERSWVFSDGFEQGDLSAWSLAVQG